MKNDMFIIEGLTEEENEALIIVGKEFEKLGRNGRYVAPELVEAYYRLIDDAEERKTLDDEDLYKVKKYLKRDGGNQEELAKVKIYGSYI